MNRTNLGYRDGLSLIEALERAQEEGDLDTVSARMPAIERLIARLQERAYELAHLQYRARMIREKHEPAKRPPRGRGE